MIRLRDEQHCTVWKAGTSRFPTYLAALLIDFVR